MLAKRNIKRWEAEHEELIARFYTTEGKIAVPSRVDEKTNVTADSSESNGEGPALKGATNWHGQTPMDSSSSEVLGEGKMDMDEDAQCEKANAIGGIADSRLQEVATTATAGGDDLLLPDSGDVGCLVDFEMDLDDGPDGEKGEKGEEEALGAALESLNITV
ncbi:hypothetical protein AbraIFM66951_003480 [Aspergillus brasiliensis]|uniref:Uncharacterized protein n=1 Tax=Aspergillus brasiliensis TaxID=319629 RepID=A0A9W5YWD3_9EURO|nr:hypothetical protein AbraCBS73388_000701 [Aspergillus brasiliensis]GKZ50344.1 hypothetical protein AbraIFM66951_003480 [Aspergillus brasiliensis]